MRPAPWLVPLTALVLAALPAGAAPVTVRLDLKPALADLGSGLLTPVWTYNGTVPGTPIVVNPGDDLTVIATNHLRVATSIHWHGVSVPVDQDGTMASIDPGATFTYRFTVPASGTFWYHSHTRPVLEQVDRGLYGAFIVLAPEDARYASDRTFLLDDWYLGPRGQRLEGTSRGGMERLGNVETVNGKTGAAIEPVAVRQGELHKFRFINASTAAVHTLKATAGTFRVTHTDGHPLPRPYEAETLVFQPGERLDVEYAATGAPGTQAFITSADRDLGLKIPLVYGPETVAAQASPYRAPASSAFAGITGRAPDFTLELNSRMKGSGAKAAGSMGAMGSMDHGSGTENIEWTINGRSFPDTLPLKVRVGQVVKVRFVNRDTAMMHAMDHPIHLHGTFFQVVAINGRAPDRETWKDTLAVPAGGSVDIAFRYTHPGDWMLHCHILDHEDQGMMLVVKVTP